VPLALWGAGVGIAVALAVLVSLSIAQASGSRSDAVWRKHHEDSHQLPDELFHRDRFHAVQGRVTDKDEKPIPGAMGMCDQDALDQVMIGCWPCEPSRTFIAD
jgi:hypothetical protein